MKHFFEYIHGWFDFDDIYTDVVNLASDNSHFVEVGSWKGKSAAYMAVEIANSGKNIKFDCVDLWTGFGVPGYEDDTAVTSQSLFEVFTKNMEPASGYYNPIRMSSAEAASKYEDESLDFIFIDASHDYASVKEDLEVWYPKLKKGRMIGGHDIHYPDVNRAVSEFFPKFNVSRSSWWLIKT